MTTPLVLIVESDLDSSFLYKETLTRLEMDVERCFSGAEGLQCLQRIVVEGRVPDVVVVDFSLPDFPGFQFVERARQIEPLRDTPIVMVSKVTTPPTLEQAREFGVEFLAKPFSIHQLRGRVLGVLETREKKATVDGELPDRES